jgi:hypothetical protein
MQKAIVRALVVLAVALTACSSPRDVRAVPSIGGTGAAGTGAGGTGAGGDSRTRVSQLHSAAECIRTHGVPTYQDPVLTADGHVYTDARSIQDLGRDDRSRSDSVIGAIRQACGSLLAAAGFQPDDEAPAPPQLVQAGVRAARCLRANGLPNYRDPTSTSQFTPGHGFGLSADELPNNGALGKQDPAVQRAFGACRALLDDEIRQSTLDALAHD